MVQYQNNSLSDVQLNLIKYCWANTTSLQEETRLLIVNCKDTMLLTQLDSILTNYVMPYFYEDRNIFNRIREHFVRFMNLCLQNTNVYGLTPYSFLVRYETICKITEAFFRPSTNELVTKLVQKAKSEITRLI